MKKKLLLLTVLLLLLFQNVRAQITYLDFCYYGSLNSWTLTGTVSGHNSYRSTQYWVNVVWSTDNNRWEISSDDYGLMYYNTTNTSPNPPALGVGTWVDYIGCIDLQQFSGAYTTSAFTVPTLSTTAASNAGALSATLGGNVTSDGGSTVTERGIVWATTANPTTSNNKVINGSGTGSFSGTVSSLTANTTIHFRAYAINTAGTSYGTDLTFTTNAALSTSSTSQTNVSCNGGSNGSATVVVSGGKTPYTYSWSPSGGTGATASILATNNYTVIITDAESTQITRNFNITQPTAVSGTTVVTNVACNGTNTGAINLTPTGGTSPYTFNWGAGVTTEDRVSLTAGSYSVTITDANGCTGTVSATVTQPPSAVSGTTVVTNVACFGGNTGAVNLTPTGGVGPYTFNWGGGITTEDRTGLTAGSYSVTITDANGCTGTVSPTVTQPAAAVSGTTVVTNVACFGGNTASINLTPTGGVGPYTFNWGGGITTEDRTGLTAGSYSVTITDANGCTGTVSPTVTQPAAAVSGTTVVTNVACFGGNTGSINLTPTGGVGPYTFNWGGGITTEDRTGLTAGSYSVTITDANGCTGTVSPTVTQPAAAVSGTTVVTNIACFGGNTGSINLTPTGGVGPYTFNWGGGITTEDRTGLTAGSYSVTITDANGCTGTVSPTVTQPTAISTATGLQTNVACNGGTNGVASVTPSGGTPGYTYSWSPSGGTAATATGLAAGSYTVTVTDANGCTATRNYTITEPTALSFTTTSLPGYDYNSAYNQTIAVAGGTGAKTYAVTTGSLPSGFTLASNGVLTGTSTQVADSNFTVTVTDANSCTASQNFVLKLNQIPITVTATASQTKIYGETDPVLTYTVTPDLLSGDSFTGTLARSVGENIGNYNITQGSLSAGDKYLITYVSKDFAITVKPVTVTATASQTKVYGTVDPTFTYTVSPSLVSGDSFTGALTRVAGENVGNYAITQGTLAANSNYSVTFTSGVNFAITQRPVTVTANAGQSKTYGNVDTILTYSVGGSGLAFSDTFSGSLSRAAGENVGNYAITQGSLAASGNYSVTFTPGINFAITQRAVTVTVNAGQLKTYGNVDPSLTYSVGGSGLAFLDTFSGSLSRAAGENVGNYAITQGSLAASGNYSVTFIPGVNFAIAQRAVTVMANAGQSKTYGNVDPSLTYSVGGSGLAFSDTFSGSLSRAAGENVGNYSITQGSLSASSNYAVTFTPGTTFAISTRAVTVTANSGQSKTYGNVDPTLTYTVGGSGLAFSDTFSGSLSRIAGENIGTYTVAQGSLNAGTNYTISYVSKDFTITAKPITVTANISQTKVYGTVDPALTYSVSPSLVGSDAFTGALTRAAGENIGTYGINQGSLSAGSNYNITYVTKDFAITAKPITVTADVSQTKVYGTVDPTFTYSVSPSLVSGDSFTGTLTRAAGENIGTYAINQGSLSAGSNYNITYVAKDFSITAKPITVIADASQAKVYGTVDPTFTYSVSPSLVSGDSFTGALTRAAGENIGTYAINQGSLSAGSNYTISYVSKDFSITSKPITVTADVSQTKVYGAVNPVYTYSVSPSLVGSDAFTGTLTRVAGENVGTYAINQGSLSAGFNYTISYVSKDFSITSKPITVTADVSQTKVYGAVNPVYTYSVSPSLVGSDAFTGALTRVAGENVGAYAINQGSLSAGSNYTISYVSKDFSITAKPITVTGTASQTKVYGATNPVYTYSVSPSLVGSDAFTGVLTRVAGENVGTYAINQGSLSAGSNYTISYVSKDFSITAKPITVTATASQAKVYGTTNPVYTYSVSPSLVGSDAFTGVLTRVAGENVGTYAINQGSLSAGSNYTISYVSKDFSITAKPITVTATASQTKVYGTTNPVYTYSVSPSLVGSDAFIGTLTRVTGENVGTYAITQGSLSAGLNYNITYVSKDFSITAKPITVTATASQTKVYGTSDPVYTYSVSPALVSGDSFTGALSRAVGENVGTYAITQGNLSAGSNYSISYVANNFSITKSNQIITWNQTLGMGCDGETTIALTAVSNSGLPVTYTSSNTNIASVSNSSLNFQNYGSATVTASQAGNNNYNAAPVVVLPVVNSQPNLIRKQFEDIIFFDNSSKSFNAYSWYKNGVLVPSQTSQYFKESGALNGTYYAVGTKLDGTLITSCPLTLSPTVEEEYIRIAPNPVRTNANFQLITNVSSNRLQNARIELYNVTGNLLINVNTNQNTVDLKSPAVEGIYIVKMTLANGKYFTKNLLVKN